MRGEVVICFPVDSMYFLIKIVRSFVVWFGSELTQHSIFFKTQQKKTIPIAGRLDRLYPVLHGRQIHKEGIQEGEQAAAVRHE